MNNKAFTLIEVMATVLIIAAIALLSFPVLTNVVKKNGEISETSFKESAILAAKTYCNLNNKGIDCSVSIEQLIKESYLDKPTNKQIEYKGLSINCNKGNCKFRQTAVQELLAKTNPESVTVYEQGSEASHQMYTFSHPATEQTEALTDYRYIGKDPYNYVDFNCDDNGENCETWRIVGVFTVKNGDKEEQRIKMIVDKSYIDKDWNTINNPFDNWNSVSEWPSSTLNTYLNGEYYQNMSSLTKSMIEPAETYLGGGVKDSIANYGSASDMYVWERGTARYDSSRSIKDTKNITLLYPSDYTYTYANGVDNVCYNDGNNCYGPAYGGIASPEKGWLYNKSYYWWLVSPISTTDGRVFIVYKEQGLDSSEVKPRWDFQNSIIVYPVVYLSADVELDGNHTGSSTDHYRLKK